MGKAEAIRTALTATGNALLAASLAPPCACCRAPLAAPLDGAVCPQCWHDARLADGRYDGALRQIIHALKYEGRRSLAVPLAALLLERHHAALAGARCIVPVPLFAWRRLRRGFNQAADLAAPLHLPVVHALWRIRSTVSQTGLTAAERQRNVRRAFCLSPLLSREKRQRFIDGQAIVLLDDVMTTGATSNECAGVLVRAGASEVRIVTLARAPLHSEGGARSFSAARETEARHP